MGNNVCCAAKKDRSKTFSPRDNKGNIVNSNQQTRPSSNDKFLEKPTTPFTPKLENKLNSPYYNDRKSDIPTERGKDASLFNLTGDYEIMKVKRDISQIQGTEGNHNKEDSLSMYQLARQLSNKGLEFRDDNTHNNNEKISADNLNLNQESGHAIKKKKAHSQPQNSAEASNRKLKKRVDEIPMAIEEEHEKYDSKDGGKLANAFKEIQNSSKMNKQKVISVISINQSSIQNTGRSHRSKDKGHSVSSYVSNLSKKSEQISGFFPKPNDTSTESNLPGRVHYDSVINKHLIPNQNKILDDSILEAQGIPSTVKLILSESSKIDDQLYPPWTDGIHEEEKFFTGIQKLFLDEKFAYDLKSLEMHFGTAFEKRMCDLQNIQLFNKKAGSKINISQGKADTCSLISPLIGIAYFEEAKRVKFIENLIYPQKDGLHIVNKMGKYGVKLYLNGTRRYIEIDDRIVYTQRTRENVKDDILLGAKALSGNQFWPSILEKAFCKLYSTPDMILASNPAIECFHLIGWIPETIRMSEITNSTHLWQRLIQNFDEDNILINFGTKEYSPGCPEAIEYQTNQFKDKSRDIIYNHCYSMMKLAEMGNIRVIKMKNPWGHTHIKSFNPKNFNDAYIATQIFESLDTSEDEVNLNGVSIVLWEDIIDYCSSIYLNWNPSVYPYRQTIHSRRDIPVTMFNPDSLIWNDEFSVEYYTQFVMKIPPHDEDFEVRIFFERHIESMKNDNMFSLSYKLFSYSGDRVIYPNDPLRTHPFQPRELLSDVFIFEASREVEIYVLALICTPTDPKVKPTIKNQTFNFTFEVFSFIEIEIVELPFRKIKQREILQGQFNKDNAGGNILSPAFLKNPKYFLTVKEKDDYHFKVEGPKDSSLMISVISVGNIDLTRERMERLNFQNFLSHNPGFYFQGFSSYKLSLKPDKYIVLISNQNRKVGDYRFYIDTLSTQLSYHKIDVDFNTKCDRFDVSSVPEYIPKVTKTLTGNWTKENSNGTSRVQTQDFQNFMKNPGYLIKVNIPTVVRFGLRSITYSNDYYETLEQDSERTYSLEPPSLSVAVYEMLPDFKFQLVLEDDHYVPAAWGYYSKETTLKSTAIGYLVLCLNYEKGYTGEYEFKIESDKPIEDIKDSTHLLKLENSYKMKGFWAKENAGGCMSEITFFKNPSYEIKTQEGTEVLIELSSEEPHHLCISLFESEGKTITEFDSNMLNNVITNAYLTQDFAFLKAKLKENTTYLMVPSTFRSAQHGRFEINIESQKALEIIEKKPINYRNKKVYPGEWSFNTNKGPLGSQDFSKNPRMIIKVLKKTSMRVHLYTPDTTSSIAIHLYDKKTLTSIKDSGSYTNMRMGCFIECELKEDSENLLVFSNFEADKYCEFFVEVSTLAQGDIDVQTSF